MIALESDEDPLPKNLRDKSPTRKASRKRNIDLDSGSCHHKNVSHFLC